MGQKYLGSVRFFRHLIIFTFLFLILAPIFLFCLLYPKVYALEKRVCSLEKEIYILKFHHPVKSSRVRVRKDISAKHKIAYLTFDDGPSAITDEILDILKAKNVKATFFVVHHNEPQTIDRLKRIVREGHAIGLHSYSHRYEQIYSSAKSFTDDIDKLSAYIRENTGYEPKILRFPGGSNNHYMSKDLFYQLKSELNKRGYVYFDWNVSSGDSVEPSLLKVENILNNCYSHIMHRNVVIILMHDASPDKKPVALALPFLIDNLKKRGYTFSVLSPDVRQIAFKK